MKYDYPNLNEDQFALIVTMICKRLLGNSVQPFTKGPDGGRDGKFTGTADLHPSTRMPWQGTVVIQSKHTFNFNASFSDKDFFSDKSATTVIGKEIPSIKKLRDSGELDHYMLFSNRRLGANAEHKILTHLSQECAIPIGSLYLCGIKGIELSLKQFPEITKVLEIDPLDSPLIISSDDMAEIVEVMSVNFKSGALPFNPPTTRVPYEKKNELNKMTDKYATEQKNRYLKDSKQIQDFLAAPENSALLSRYDAATAEFNLNVVSKRSDYHSFDEVMNLIARQLFGRESVLAGNKSLTRAILFYMYWNCDIGEVGDASSE